MNATAENPFQGLPVLLRSEAFAEDLFEPEERTPALPEAGFRWLVNLAPLAVAMVGLAFAVVPPIFH